MDRVAWVWFVIVMVTSVVICRHAVWSVWQENIMNPVVLGIIIILLVGISPVVHNKKGKTYSFPLAGLAITLLAYSLIG